MRIPISDHHLFTLSFADNQSGMLAQDAADLNLCRRGYIKTYERWKLQVSLHKSEYLVINSTARFEVLREIKQRMHSARKVMEQ